MSETLTKPRFQGATVLETEDPFQRTSGVMARLEIVLTVTLIIGFVVAGMIPAWSHLSSDFRNYYLAARLYRQGYPLERVYEWVWFQRQWDHVMADHGLVGFQPLTLLSALVIAPFASLSPLEAKRCWILLNLGFLLITTMLLVRCTDLGWRRVLLLTFLAFVPLRSNFIYGQMHLFVLLLLTLAAFLYFKRQHFWSGISLAIAAALKIYPALFVPFFIIKRRWTGLAGLFCGMSATVLLSIYLFGINACQTYANEVLPRALRSQIINPYAVAWGSWNALLARLFIAEPELNPSPVIHCPWLYAVVYAFLVSSIVSLFLWAIGFTISEPAREKLEWSGYLFLLLFLSSQPAPYHFVVLILCSVLVMDYLLKHGQLKTAAIMGTLYILACGSYTRLLAAEPSGWHTLLHFPRLICLLLYSGMFVNVLIRSAKHSALRVRPPTPLIPGLVFIGLFAIGAGTTWRHLRGQFENYSSRVTTVGASAMAGDPVVGSRGLFFTALVPRFLPSSVDTYAVHELKDSSIASFAIGGDWFHPAAGKEYAWAEMATTGGSRIVRFDPNRPLSSTSEVKIEAENAEQPVVSADGELLAFLREERGRNSLWIRWIKTREGPGNSANDQLVAGPNYDAREVAFFADDSMIFSARRDGRFRLHKTVIGSGVIQEMNTPACSARFPAVSPDGLWLAFSCEQGGSWQIQVMNLNTQNQMRLTNSDCNSVSPVWTPDSKDVIYATDCGRGLGLTALAQLHVFR